MERRDGAIFDPIYDIDSYRYMRHQELLLCSNGNFMEYQEHISPRMRLLAVDWLVEITIENRVSAVSFP